MRLRISGNINRQGGFSLVELSVVIAIIAVMAGAITAMMGSFSHRRQLEAAAVMLLSDLRQTQQFARVQKDEYKYYGLRFYNNLGEDASDGYKILRYEPPGGKTPQEMDPAVPGDLDLNRFSVVKSPLMAPDTPQLLENTFFGPRVSIAADSELKVGDSVVFTFEGSATSDGITLLAANQDTVKLTLDNNKGAKTIEIIPLTGYVRIQ